MTISLSTLKSLRAAMTQGRWVSDASEVEDGQVWTAEPYKLVMETHRHPMAANATGIVATHNAADVLIAAVQAAIDFALIQETLAPGDFAAPEFGALWDALQRFGP